MNYVQQDISWAPSIAMPANLTSFHLGYAHDMPGSPTNFKG